MQKGKIISTYMKHEQITRLDILRGKTSRSKALDKALAYLLSQDDTWIKSLICDQGPDSNLVLT